MDYHAGKIVLAGDGASKGSGRDMAPPELMDDLVGEILLRVPPGEPACLVRASLVCKPWRRVVSDPAFGRRYRAFHRTRLRIICARVALDSLVIS
ncbi:uncharacterized protein LOC133885644 [Phragmites australis]|uniref:uncharacterized protein LOC133885644 n=1 Tax=Phragmites australis TaxID=29695 RepID=UPI002D79260F|nr:uncharacterized protein LOC133885644 [Phragmites australis]